MRKLFLAIFLLIVMVILTIYWIYLGIGVVKYIVENIPLIVKNPEANFSIKNNQLLTIVLFLVIGSLFREINKVWDMLLKKS